MITLKYKIESVAPILFHNVNSMDLIKPKKISHAEWEESNEVLEARLYLEDGLLTIPPRVIIGMLKNSAQKSGIRQDGKRSTYAGIIRAVVFCLESMKLDQKLGDIIKHKEYVAIQKSKILRVFPMLKKWSGVVEFTVDESQISIEVIDELMLYGGSFIGFGDYRPQYGRFTATRIK